jgi:hypothetical protein
MGTYAFSQLNISPYAGWNFGMKARVYEGDIRVKNNTTFGVDLDYLMDGTSGIQLTYRFTSTDVTLYPWGEPTRKYSDVDLHYIMLGGIRHLMDGPVMPYGVFNIGILYADFKNGEQPNLYTYDDVVRLAFGFGLGLKVMFNERIGLNTAVRALVPVQWGGLSLGCSTGGGCGTGVSTGSSIISGDVTGGIVVVLGD